MREKREGKNVKNLISKREKEKATRLSPAAAALDNSVVQRRH